MGFLDKVKEMASEGLEKGQELAKTQQLKLELKKLEGQLEEAYTALGKKASEHIDAGALSAEAVSAETQAIQDAKAAITAKQAEIDAIGDDDAQPASTS